MPKKKDKDIQTEDKSAEVSHDDGTPVESEDSTDQAASQQNWKTTL